LEKYAMISQANRLFVGLALLIIPVCATRAEKVGEWRVETDSMTEPMAQFTAELEAAGLPTVLRVVSFDIRYDGDARPSEEQKAGLQQRWSSAVIEALKRSGLRLMDGPEATPDQRRKLTELRQKMFERMPFGMRNQTQDRFGVMAMLIDDRRAPCTTRDGAYAGFVMTIRPTPNVTSDFGSIAVFTLGMGSCGEKGSYAERRLGYTFDRARWALVDQLQARGPTE
jgi:hypothetical protein